MKKENILFSIIIPVRQSNPYLEETKEKLKEQTFKNFELLVIDDTVSGSANPAKKRNIGAKKAKGDYLVFLDDDSYPHHNHLKNIARLIKKHPDYAAFCGPSLTPKKDNCFQKASGLVWSSFIGSGGAGSYRNGIQSARFVDDYPSVNLTVKKDDFNKIGGFKISYWPGEDTLLCLDLTEKLKKKIYYHPSIRVYHHRRSVIIPHLQQITRYAIHRGLFARKFPKNSLKIGYFIPTLFFFYILFLIINSLVLKENIPFITLPLYLYISILITTFLKFLFDNEPLLASFLAIITIPITHLYYGILFLHGLFKKDIKFKAHKVDSKTGKYIGG